MSKKESVIRMREQIDTVVTRLTRNKITERQLGPMTLVIHERRLGRWTKVLSSYSEIPIHGKTHDIVYTIFDGVVERKRLGTIAQEQRSLRAALRTSPAT